MDRCLPEELSDLERAVFTRHAEGAGALVVIGTTEYPDTVPPIVSQEDRFRFPALSTAEVHDYVAARTGRCSVSRALSIRAATGGHPAEVDRYIDSHDADFWLRDEPAATGKDVTDSVSRGDLGMAVLQLGELTAAHPDAALIHTYTGRRVAAADALATGVGERHRQLFALADWDIPGLVDGAAPELRAFGTAVLSGTRTDIPGNGDLHHLCSGWLALAHDDPTEARALLERPFQSPLLGLWAKAVLARCHFVLGDWDEALQVVDQGIAAGNLMGTRLLTPMLTWTGAQIAAMRGRHRLARGYLEEARSPGESFLIQSLPGAMARMAATEAVADLPATVRAGEQLRTTLTNTASNKLGFWAWEDIYALSLVRAGRVTAAARIMDEAQEGDIPSLRARNMVPRAAILIQEGSLSEGTDLLESAADLARSAAIPVYEARVAFQAGLLLRRNGKRNLAEKHLGRAAEVYSSVGAVAMVEACALGNRRGLHSGGGIEFDLLTPQENQIVALVTAGATNQEAAHQLSVSVKTVEYHLTRIYRKLGVAGRAELKGAAREA
ncbi:LuxR C-terminal-related transcriptional regulator [Corynebacterium frankenforstense]|uniref:LuxR C-terminal-related transcriptional regulator n=1 Tax=Corynebacterium frankenforstense TaxID=1230998 RepID=UPI002550984F|nr:LuxR family transcriptional regulator [Corynebacterium frankenforstense]MDK6259367.1 LuxR C-terminal-related transcriptional regulator [Corynebacterium frankenforstense]